MYRRMYGDYVPGYGDPGIFGAIGHVLGGAALGFITGGPLGAIKGAVVGTAAGVKKGIQQETLAAGGGGSAYTPALRAQHAAVVARAKAGGSTIPLGGSMAGTPHARAMLHAGRVVGGLRRRRRMNWANPKALGRAERRIHSAVKHFTKYIRWVHPGRAGHAAPKFSGKKKR